MAMRLHDRIISSPVGTGQITGFSDRGFPKVNGILVAWCVRADGEKYGRSPEDPVMTVMSLYSYEIFVAFEDQATSEAHYVKTRSPQQRSVILSIGAMLSDVTDLSMVSLGDCRHPAGLQAFVEESQRGEVIQVSDLVDTIRMVFGGGGSLGLPEPNYEAITDLAAGWSQEVRRGVLDWAMSIHLSASDNDNPIEPCPQVITEYMVSTGDNFA